ncbi:hypothetical protein A9G45_07250 [Gilliamella sp. HK2]|uniref:hypothetical protein n=1 Tax=unclassified Gilliamella TaxID=2685620 RepID=UPI00080E47BE|nr:hypothetical protein [Gilliamella apicola]OCG28217.1 hypothetical protein A9G45_07250 [Gilliamella apicola]OCG28374.1 hypothetical protein A9G46_02445 [Gilliamella apicola]
MGWLKNDSGNQLESAQQPVYLYRPKQLPTLARIVKRGSEDEEIVYVHADLNTSKPENKFDRVPHFYTADDLSGDPLQPKVRYNQYGRHIPENMTKITNAKGKK